MASKNTKDRDPSIAASKGGVREELVGKRFLLVQGGPKPKITRVQEWSWKAGVIRCATHVDCKDPDLQILVEFDLLDWQKRDWLNVYKDNLHLLLIEENLVLAPRTVEPFSKDGNLHPALTFKPLVDNVGLWKNKHNKPVEFLGDLRLDFQDCNKLKTIRHWDPKIPGINQSTKAEKSINAWSELQDGQQILITTPSVLLGFRIKVYRAEGTTQWYTAVTTGYNETSSEFTLTDDTVLEEHYEDPRLTQMLLLGDGVVSSILRGENIGITPRRSRNSTIASCMYSPPNRKQSNKFPSSLPSRSPSSQKLSTTNTSETSTSTTPSRRGGPGRGHTGPRDPTVGSNVNLKSTRDSRRSGLSSLGDSFSSSDSSSPVQSPTASSPPLKDKPKNSQKNSTSTKPSVSTTSPSSSKPKSVTTSRSQSIEDLPIATALARSRNRGSKNASPPTSTSSSSSTTKSQKSSQSQTKRDHSSSSVTSSDTTKEAKYRKSKESDTLTTTKYNKNRLRRSNSSMPLNTNTSSKTSEDKSSTSTDYSMKEDTATLKTRGRKRLKTRSSRIPGRLSTDLPPSEQTKNDNVGTLKRDESETSVLIGKEPHDANRQSKSDVIESTQFAVGAIPTTLTDSTGQEKLTNLPPSRTASLNNSSSGGSNSKRKAVAIVRPQPQQLKQNPQLVDSRKLSNESTPSDLQTKLENENIESSLSEKLITKGENKIGKELKRSFSRSRIKPLSPKAELRKLQKEREDRFSLYDFPSDSENEPDSSPSSLSSLGKSNSGGLEIEDKSTSTNVINKNIDKSSLSIKSSNTELKAVGNNNSSTDCLISSLHSSKGNKTSPSASPPLATSRLKPKTSSSPEVVTEQPISKLISTLSPSHGCSTFSRLPITTIASSFPTFDTTTTSSASINGNNNKPLRVPNNDLGEKQLSDKAGVTLSTGNVQGPSDSLVGSQNKDANSSKLQQKSNPFPTKIPSTVNLSSYSSCSTSISRVQSLRMQADTNTVSASSNYHPSQHTNQLHQQGEHHPSASYANLRDDRSDSGLSTLRSDGARSSGDERSGSRSSAVSDEILLRVAGGGPAGSLQASHSGRPNSANATEHTRLPTHTPPTSVTFLNPPFGSGTTSSRQPLHPTSSSASPTWKEISAYNKLLPGGQLQANINKQSKLSALSPMSSDTRPPPPSAVSRGGSSGALVPTTQALYHLQSSVPAVGVPPPTVSSSITSQQHAAVAAAMSAAQQQQWASVAAAHQYQAALQAASLVASQQPAQAAQQALLNQYQSLAAASAAGITPDVLKQFPHLATGLPHHLLAGRGSAGSTTAVSAHHDILMARERELAERDRVIRERREAEQRLERDRIDKERIEKERLDRERRERERREERDRIEREQRREQERRERERKDQMSKVDEHFKLSMEYHNKYDTYMNAQRMNATSQAQHWSQQLSSSARAPVGGSSARALHLPPNSIPVPLDNERQRYEAERRLTLEAEQNRQYLNALASNRHGVGALPPPPAHSSLSNRVSSSKLPPSATTGYSSSNPTYQLNSRHDPGPPPPLLRADGSSFLQSSSTNNKGTIDPRYSHLPPTTVAYKPLSSQNYDKDVYGAHHLPPHPRGEPSPNTLSGSLALHTAMPTSAAASHNPANHRGISPASTSSISPPDLRRAATQINAAHQQYKYPASSYSPGSHHQPGVTPPLSLQSRSSPVTTNNSASRQRVNSPAAPGQMYGKPHLPARTVEARPSFSPGSHTEGPVAKGTNVAPPPAHGGSVGRSASHDHHNDPRNDPRYLLPSAHLNPQRKPIHQQYLPSPPVSSANSYTPHSVVADGTKSRTDDVPLDLGVSTKRRCEPSMEKDTSYNSSVSPRKNAKLDSTPGVLFKVSEPSVLITSEPSTITTVINSALVNEDKSSHCNTAQNLSTSQKLTLSNTQDDQQSHKSGGDSESSYSQQPITPASKPDSPSSKDEPTTDTSKPPGYVHKLKKAWIQAYSTNDGASTTSSTGEKQSSGSNNPQTPTTTRATPSPSLSNRSSTSASSSTITKKRGTKSKSSNQSGGTSKPATPQSFNGHSSSPRRAGGSKSNKGSDFVSDGSSDTGDRNGESSGEDDTLSLRTKRSASVTSGGSKKKGKKRSIASISTKRGRAARTRNARNNAAVRNRKESSGESSADEEVNSSDTSKRSDVSTSRKRGRKPATTKSRLTPSKDEPRSKKEKNENLDDTAQIADDITNPFQRPPVAQLKRTGESFLQDKPCLKEAPRLAKCRECRLTESQRNKQMPNIFCRFYAFRRLKYAKNGQVSVAGFCDPNRDYSKEDDALWNISPKSAPKNLTADQAKYLIENTRTDFDLIIQQERRAVKLHSGEEDLIAWKRMVQGVREMCDVCEANLFNYHWACGRCGFVVCVDCYHDRKNDLIRKWPNAQHMEEQNGNSNGDSNDGNSSTDGKNAHGHDSNKYDQKDKYCWLLCTNKSQHDLEKLMLTQIITGKTLENVYDKLKACHPVPLKAIKNEKIDCDTKTLVNGDIKYDDKNSDSKDSSAVINKCNEVDDKISSNEALSSSELKSRNLVHYVRPSESEYAWSDNDRPDIKSYSISETKSIYSGVVHSWLCNGFVLRIDANSMETDKNQSGVLSLFKEVWQRGQPVVFSDMYRKMDVSLWAPHRMAEEFADIRTEFIDAATGASLGNHLLRKFFDGFSVTSRRSVKNKDGKPSIVRLNDWPPQGGEDFLNALPVHAADFHRALPFPIYTANKENSVFNLSASLPDVFMRPDVGPRAMLSYGAGAGDDEDDNKTAFDAIVNLTSETCDTLSLLVHAEVPRDVERDSFRMDIIKMMESSSCDTTSCRRVIDAKELPGILWHIFHPSDADKVKDLLNKIVAKERTNKKQHSKQNKTTKKRVGRKANSDTSKYEESSDDTDGEKVEKNFDVIQAESHYLDEAAIETLKQEYGVTPFVVAQFPGEAIVLPAGAPFQMKHILSCVSLSSDFVSPENVSHSFYLTRQMRYLSEEQNPAEDKIQIKNLIYHSVKNALSTLETTSLVDVKTESKPTSTIKEQRDD